jgi:dTDP-glucose 4,6-dehydratase
VILVTGGAGFIGSNFIHGWLGGRTAGIINFDKLTYAGNRSSLRSVEADPRYAFIQGDVGDFELVARVLAAHNPAAVVNFAAESHVDRSIHGPEDFIQTNIVGTFRLLEAVRAYWGGLPVDARSRFRFLHVSTDEVFGSLEPQEAAFHEKSAYAPNSPYAASKAASEKLIPLVILNALAGKPLPIYGDGQNVRDWLYVGDHCAAIRQVLERGRIGETYNIGGNSERTNIDVVRAICRILDELRPHPRGQAYQSLITHVADRPGHDRRYAIDSSKIGAELGWKPVETFESGLRRTVQWYLQNGDWVAGVSSGEYRLWLDKNYARRETT